MDGERGNSAGVSRQVVGAPDTVAEPAYSYDEYAVPVLLPAREGTADNLPRPATPKTSRPVERVPGSFPYRAVAMLVLALFAQAVLEPPDRSATLGIALYLIAFGVGVWGILAGEFSLPALPTREREPDRMEIPIHLIWVLGALTALSFLAFLFSGNQFGAFNLLLWFAAIGLVFWIFLHRQAYFRTVRRRLADTWQALKDPANLRWAAVLVLAAGLIVFFRFHSLENVPPQMFSDQAEKLQDVQDVLQGQHRIFFPRNTGREFLQMYMTAFTASVLNFGLSFMALKMGAAIFGLLTLPYIYLLGKELGNQRVGLFAMVLAGISYWLNVISRVALRFFLYPMFVAPVLFHIFRGLRTGRRSDFVWAGFFLGLGLHGYSTFRFVPILVVLLFILFLLHTRSQWRTFQPVFRLGVVVTLAFIMFLPLLGFISASEENRQIVFYRSMTRLGEAEREYPGPVGQIFADNLLDAMAMMAWDNGSTWVHSVTGRPALDVVSGALYYLGFGLVGLRYLRRHRWEDGALLFCVPFLMMPSILSLAFPAENPSLNRTGGAIIPVFIIAGMALDGLLSAVKSWGGARWGRTAGWGLVGFLLLWTSINNYDLIFRQYFEQFERNSWNTTELGGVIRGFADSVGSEDTAWVIPWPHWVDTRLVGINAGVVEPKIRDYAISRENLVDTLAFAGPKLFLLNTQDSETLAVLEDLYPQGVLQTYVSEVEGKDFLMYLVMD